MKNELDKLFESLSEGDKTTLSEPAEVQIAAEYLLCRAPNVCYFRKRYPESRSPFLKSISAFHLSVLKV